jgi:Ca2+-binding RTX toxin-like protein
MNDNTFIAGVNLSVPVIPLEWKVEAMSDFNADGHVDILWRNYATGENHLWYMNNATVTAGYNLSIATVSLDWEIVGAIDTGGWGGSDTIVSSVSYTLATSGIENLRLDGNGNINGTGDDNANLIMGNPGNNVLDGRGGNDVLDGSAGVDTYTGGAGSDRFVIRLQSSSVDQITDFQTGVGGDVLDLRSIWLGMTPPQNVNASNIGNYVQLSVVSGNTLLSVDFDGTGPAGAEALVTLNGLTGLDPLTLLQQGNLLVS